MLISDSEVWRSCDTLSYKAYARETCKFHILACGLLVFVHFDSHYYLEAGVARLLPHQFSTRGWRSAKGVPLQTEEKRRKFAWLVGPRAISFFFFSDQVYSMVSILPQLFTMLCRLIFLSCLGELLICTYCSHLPLGALRRRKCRVCFLLFRAPFPRESNLRGAPSVLFFLFGWAALFLWGIVDAKKK